MKNNTEKTQMLNKTTLNPPCFPFNHGKKQIKRGNMVVNSLSDRLQADQPEPETNVNLKTIKTGIVFCSILFFSLLAFLPATGYADLNDGLVAWYPFNGNASDESGNGNNGTLHNDIQATTDRHGNPGQAFQFDGVDDYISVPSSASLNPENQLTISFWGKVDVAPEKITPVINKGGIYISGHKQREYTLWLSPSNILHVSLAGDEQELQRLESSIQNYSEWFFFTFVVDKINHSIKIYINGVLNSETEDSYSTFNNNNEELWFGQCAESLTEYSWFNGILDEVRIYNRALSESEIVSLYAPAGQSDLTPGLSAIDILKNNKNATSGVYWIDPDGDGSIEPFQAYCDMTTDGGGWTLLMKLNGDNETFQYSSAYWTDSQVFNAASPDFDTTEAKLQSYNSVPFDEVLLVMKQTTEPITDVRHLVIETEAESMAALMAGGHIETALGRDTWTGLLSTNLLPNCNHEGLNNTLTSSMQNRIGILGNNETDCTSCDSALGFGNTISGHPWGSMPSCGGGQAGSATSANGWVFVRDLDSTLPSDLKVSLEFNPDTIVVAGSEVAITATITNTGSGAVTSPFNVDFNINGQLLRQVLVETKIPVNGSHSVTYNWPATFGNNPVEVKVDSGDQITELSETNNSATGNIDVADNSVPTVISTTPSDGSNPWATDQIEIVLEDLFGLLDAQAIADSIVVTHVESGQVISGTVTENNGVFIFTPDSPPLPDGTYTVTFTAKDTAGNSEDHSFTFIVKNPLSGSFITATIDHTKVDEELTDFPLLLHLSEKSGTGGYDLSAMLDTVMEYSVNDDFTGENGAPLNQVKWSENNSAEILDNKLLLSTSPSLIYSSVTSIFHLQADFDIQVDFSFDLFPSGIKWQHGFKIVDGNDSAKQIQIGRGSCRERV